MSILIGRTPSGCYLLAYNDKWFFFSCSRSSFQERADLSAILPIRGQRR